MLFRSWSPEDINWLDHHIKYLSAQKEMFGHRASSKYLDDAAREAAAAQEAILEKQIINLTQVHRAADRAQMLKGERAAPAETKPQITRADAAEAWETDKPEGHLPWGELSPTAQAHWQAEVADGSHLHPETNKALRNELDTLSRGEAAEQEQAQEIGRAHV